MDDLEILTNLPFDVRIKTFFDYLSERRLSGPVTQSTQANVWEVFRYDEAVQVLLDYQIFSSDMNAAVPAALQQLARAATGHLAGIDPPRHDELRGLVNRAFTPRVVAALEPRISSIVERLLDDITTAGAATVDVVGDFASPLSATVIAELFGIPDGDHRMFSVWADTLLNAKPAGKLGVADSVAMSKVADLVREVGEYLVQYIRDRRARPGNDLTSNLAAAEVDGHSLGDDEIIGVMGMFLIAGYLPTSVLIGNTVMCLDEYPEVFDEVRLQPAVLPKVIEEVLRWRPPLVRDQRIAKSQVELGGRTVPAGSAVCVWLASANRDEFYFSNPDEFDVHRDNGRHLAFGRGIHYCLGMSLTRLECRIALGALMRRFGRINVLRDDGVEFHKSIGMLGPSRLPVEIDLEGDR
ncbi:MAG: cytochrome P450 [Pseudonocardiaceae bacterium]